jgi:hypothetical protein
MRATAVRPLKWGDFTRRDVLPIFEGHLVTCYIQRAKRDTRLIDFDLFTYSCDFDLAAHAQDSLKGEYARYTLQRSALKRGRYPWRFPPHCNSHSIWFEVANGDVSQWFEHVYDVLCDASNLDRIKFP